jgi:hypothetical protein
MSPIDAAFFEAFARCSPLMTVQTERTPPEMIVRVDEESEGWIEWRLIPCEGACDPVLRDLERACRVVLPPSFRRWYGSYYTLDMDVSVVRLPENPSNDPGGPLRRLLTNPAFREVRDLGLMPFGDEARGDAGPLCFDARGGGDPDAWPVTFWDHERAGMDQAIGPIMFSSFDRLLIGCTAYMHQFEQLKGAIAQRGRWTSQDHRDCTQALMAADPEGAGGPGRAYWAP